MSNFWTSDGWAHNATAKVDGCVIPEYASLVDMGAAITAGDLVNGDVACVDDGAGGHTYHFVQDGSAEEVEGTTGFADDTLTIEATRNYYPSGATIQGLEVYPDGGVSPGVLDSDEKPMRIDRDGNVVWENTTTDGFGRFLQFRTGLHGVWCTQNRHYLTGDTTSARGVYCIDASDGSLVWSVDSSESNNAGVCALSDDSKVWSSNSDTTGQIREYDNAGNLTAAYNLPDSAEDCYGLQLNADETSLIVTSSFSGNPRLRSYEIAAMGGTLTPEWSIDTSSAHSAMVSRTSTRLNHDGIDKLWLTTGTAIGSVWYGSIFNDGHGAMQSIDLGALAGMSSAAVNSVPASCADAFGAKYTMLYNATGPQVDILKFDAGGNFLWSSMDRGVVPAVHARSIAVDRVDGTIYIGDTAGNVTFITQS